MFSFTTNEQTRGNPVVSCMLNTLVNRQDGRQPVQRHCCLLFVVHASADYNKTRAYTAACPVNNIEHGQNRMPQKHTTIMTYGIIFWGNSPHSTNIFKIQKRIIRIMTKSRSRDSCRQLFKRLENLPLQSQYILSVLLFVVKNKDLYTTNQEIHSINTISNINLHPAVCNLTVFQKGVYFSGIKLFNHLPLNIKCLSSEIKSFKPALKRFLNLHSFYFKHSYNQES